MGVLEGLQLVNHGGLCCGVKTIYGFGFGPGHEHDKEPALTKKTQNNNDACGSDVRSDVPFFTDDSPSETKLERLDRYIKFMKKRRPGSIVEVCLAESNYQWSNQYQYWNDILLERGFRESVKAKNSNSGNVVHVYHLVIAEETSIFDPTIGPGDDIDDSSDYDEDDELYDEY